MYIHLSLDYFLTFIRNKIKTTSTYTLLRWVHTQWLFAGHIQIGGTHNFFWDHDQSLISDSDLLNISWTIQSQCIKSMTSFFTVLPSTLQHTHILCTPSNSSFILLWILSSENPRCILAFSFTQIIAASYINHHIYFCTLSTWPLS